MYLTPIFEFSEDDLTDSTPTWQDVTSVLLEAEWSGGIRAEGDDPTPGEAKFRLHDNARNFEPDHTAGAFYPNVVPDRRFRLRVTSTGYAVGATVSNPTFDAGITGWTEVDSGGATMTPTYDTTTKRSGAGSLKLVESALEDDYMRATFAGVAGTTYRVRAWCNSTVYSGGFTLMLVHDVTAGVVVEHRVAAGTSGWELREVVITPGATGNVSVRLYSCIGTLFWDDVTVETLGAATYGEGVWFSQVFEPVWPDNATGQQVSVTCGDGMTVLALDDLPALDPPEAETYDDVEAFDEPWGSWGLDDPAGTKATARFRVRFRGKGKNRRKIKRRRGTTYVTRSEAESVSGPAGVYVGLPLLGQPGPIVGDTATATRFTRSLSQWVRVIIEENKAVADGGSVTGCRELTDQNRLTVEAWVKQVSQGTAQAIVSGPGLSAGGIGVFEIGVNASDLFYVQLAWSGGGSTTLTGDFSVPAMWQHVAATWDGNTIKLYTGGAEFSKTTDGRQLAYAGNLVGDRPWVHIGRTAETGGATDHFDGYIGRVNIYEHALSAERVLAHYTAGTARGYPEQDATLERIPQLAASSLWSVSSAGPSRDVLPIMFHGQSTLDELSETLHALGPKAMFFFSGTGNAVVLGHNWQDDNTDYNTVTAMFGNGAGEVPYENVQLVSDDDTYNTVLASHESGEAVEVSTGAVPARVNTEWTDVLLMDHNHVESLADHVLDFYKDAQFRPAQLELSGVDRDARYHIFARDIGDLVRVKVRPRGTGEIRDRVCNIIGYEKRLDAETGDLSCTWFLSRGFNAGAGLWRAGVVGFSEAGSTTVAA